MNKLSKLWDSLPLATRTCIAIAGAIPPGALLSHLLCTAIAPAMQYYCSTVQASWQQGEGLLAMLVLVLAAEVAMIVQGENS